MDIQSFQAFIDQYYREKGWADFNIFIRMGFLSEEVGEVSRAIRSMEIGRDRPDEPSLTEEEKHHQLVEELGDVMGNLIVIANTYDIPLEDIFQAHQEKLLSRT